MSIKKIAFLNFLLVAFSFTSCVNDDNFDTPDLNFEEPELGGEVVTIASVKGNLGQSDDGIYSFEETNTFLEGYVISSDEGGNFFEEIVIQDKPENPTSGIVLQVDVNPLFTTYEFGRKIYIKLDGLTVTEANGVVQLGVRDGANISKLQSSLVNEFIYRSTDVAEITPVSVSISDFSEELESIYIQVDDVQFNRRDVLGENRITFAAETADEFDGERLLESCGDSPSAVLSTSTFSDFKSLLLPQGRGTINAVLSRDFYDEFYILAINSPADIHFDSNERCDPIDLACGQSDAQGATILFEDDFESYNLNKPIIENGWTNFIESGSQQWESYRATGTNASQGISAHIDSYQSGDVSSISWLVTPAIDLTSNPGARLRFETSNSFADGSELEVLFSKDWDGTAENIPNATWGIVLDAYITRDTDFFGDWYSSDIVDLSCETGTMYIAFKFTGNRDAEFDGAYELDNVRITAD